MMIRAEITQRFLATAGYGGASVFAGLTLADIDLIIRITVGVVSIVSILVHLAITIRKERSKK